MHQAERGLFELRRGRVVRVTGEEKGALVAAVESLADVALDALRRHGDAPPRLIVTSHRAAAMGLQARPLGDGSPNGRPPAWAVPLPAAASPEEIVRLSSSQNKRGWSATDVRMATPTESAALRLVHFGRSLPAVVAAPMPRPRSPELDALLTNGTLLSVPTEEIETIVSSGRSEVEMVSEATVPLASTEDARFLLFRETSGFFEHVAVVVGDIRDDRPLPVRIHSACVTGDLFDSLRCDCGEQLRRSMALFSENGGGALLYLAHEGRSIGLANKLRAYTMQEDGLDTVEADCHLGFGPDERHYDVAVRILQHLRVERIRLLTNNPDKVRAMDEAGIQVVDRQPLHGSLNPHNLSYLSAKARRAGHWMEGMLSRRLPDG